LPQGQALASVARRPYFAPLFLDMMKSAHPCLGANSCRKLIARIP
jgi:hypothetical protein